MKICDWWERQIVAGRGKKLIEKTLHIEYRRSKVDNYSNLWADEKKQPPRPFFWHSDSLKYASSHLFHALGLLFIKKITGVRISLHFTGKEHVQPIKTKVIIFSLTRKKNELSFYTYACKYFKFFPVIRIHSCRSKESILLVNGNKFMNQYFFILIEKCEVQSL